MHGTCLDYIFHQMAVPNSVALEIYDKDDSLSTSSGDVDAAELALQHHPSTSRPNDLGEGDGMSSAECLAFFNPLSQDGFDNTTQLWASAIADMTFRLLQQPKL